MTIDETINARLAAAEQHAASAPEWQLFKALSDQRRLQQSAQRQAIEAIRNDPDLNETARKRKAAELTAAFRQAVKDTQTEADRLLTSMRARAQAKVRVKPPEGISDAALSHARQDAMMVLDRASDDQIPQRLQTLARSDDPAVRYLILGAGWDAKYLLARGHNPAAATWQALKAPLFEAALDDEGRAAQAQLNSLMQADAAHQILSYSERASLSDGDAA